MTITVNGPNGVRVNFPEGTDAGTIDKVMREAVARSSGAVEDTTQTLAGNPTYRDQLQAGLQAKADQMVIGPDGSAHNNPLTAAAVAAGNTIGFKIPEYLGAGAATLAGKLGVPGFQQAGERGFSGNLKLAQRQDEALANRNPVGNAAGTVAGIGTQIAMMGPLGIPATVGVNTAGGATERYIESGGDVGEAVKGGLLGLGGTLAGYGVGKLAGRYLGNRAAEKATEEVAPSAAALDDMVSSAYKTAKDQGVWYSPKSAAKFVDDLKGVLSKEGIEPDIQTQTAKAVALLEKRIANGEAITLDALDNVRKAVNNAFAPGMSKADKRGLYMVKQAIDDFAEKGDAIVGNKATAVQALQEGRAAFAAKSRAERIAMALKEGSDSAKVSGSGGNVDNSVRRELKKVIKYTQKDSWTPEEWKKLNDAAYGRGSLRLLGKMSPSNPLYAMLASGLGYSIAGPAALASPVVGALSKAVADSGTKKATRAAEALARARVAGPAGMQKIAQARIDAQRRAAIVAALAGGSGVSAITQASPQ